MGATHPISSWEFFYEARQVLGQLALQRIFGMVSTTHLYRWGRNPECTSDSQPGPLIHIAELLRQLVAQGRPDLAEAGLRLLAEPCGALVSFAGVHAQADPPETHSAAANIVEAVAELQRAARTGADPKIVEAQADVLLARVDELVRSVRGAQAEAGAKPRPRWSRGDGEDAASSGGLLARFAWRRGR